METDPTLLEYFDYDLPEERISQTPANPRDTARMLADVATDSADTPAVSTVGNLAEYLRPGDVVVVNNTRVLAARLFVTKPTGGRVEVFLLEPTGRPSEWRAMISPGKRVAVGTKLTLDGEVMVVAGERLEDGLRLVTLADDAIERAGQIPLPPYITSELADSERYQTMFAEQVGSVAAPTAGLHFTLEMCRSLNERGVDIESVELRVGIGTFRPIRTERITDHEMHAETYAIDQDTWDKICRTRANGGRVVAVGTTVVRALESAAAFGALSGSTSLFIDRSHRWQVVDVLLTNFHMPKSSLLVLVDSFHPGRWVDLYQKALDSGFSFLSFGDCMLVERTSGGPG